MSCIEQSVHSIVLVDQCTFIMHQAHGIWHRNGLCISIF
uniref:Uncharacterized protein n=1 Tax=Arundo donax TaxID=35708 RepID=A0A0A9FK70_ARUDO